MRRLRALGWEGPFSGGRHALMRHPFTRAKVAVPNPHRGDIDWSLTKRILAQAGVTPEDWDAAAR